MERKPIVIDAAGLILGRLASRIAKMLLNGEHVIVVNVDKTVVSGDPKMVVQSYKMLFNVTTYKNPYRHSLKRPRTPERIFKSADKGMLPMDKPRGRAAFKRLKVYCGVPPELEGVKTIKIPEASCDRLGRKYITLAEIAQHMGWKPRVA